MMWLLYIVAEEVWTIHDYLCHNVIFIYLDVALRCRSTFVCFNVAQNLNFRVKYCVFYTIYYSNNCQTVSNNAE